MKGYMNDELERMWKELVVIVTVPEFSWRD
jgi:hypothetical protein